MFCGTSNDDGADQRTSELEILCSNGFRKANLQTYDDLTMLVAEIDSGHGNQDCPARVEDAIKELAQLIDADRDNICTLEKAAKISQYYREFLDTSRFQIQQNELPKTLRLSALAYGFHVITRCKSAMVDKLVKLADDFKTDFELMEELDVFTSTMRARSASSWLSSRSGASCGGLRT